MVSREVVEKHLEDLATRVARLRRFQGVSLEEFRSDWEKVYAAERALQTAIQNVIDIGAHILADLGDSQWNEYRDIPERLFAHGVIPREEVSTLKAMIGMRNILVHQYVDVDVAKLHQAIRERLADFDHFAQAIVRYLERASR